MTTTRDELAREIQRTAGFDEHDDLTLTRVQADAILDAILPQITTVEELEALPVGTKWIGANGAFGELGSHEITYLLYGSSFHHPYWWLENDERGILPLTVVWRP